MYHLKFFLFLVCLVIGSSTSVDAQRQISRIEPPNWWAGMKNPDLQLLIYGENISDLNPAIEYSGLRIKQVIKVPNPNYLFIDLHIRADAQPGSFKINFSRNGKLVESHVYELLLREAGSAERKGFTNSDVMYLITPDRFVNGNPANDNVAGLAEKINREFKGGRHGGDIQGMIDRLDYIERLGFNAIWVNPVLENNQPEYSYHGYSTTDFYRVDPRFGTNEEYKMLCDLARQRGIKMIMDMIVNHCGSEHWWMKDLPTEDWINYPDEYVQTNHRKTTVQDPHVSDIDRKNFVDGWFVETMPDLNQRNEMLATYLTQNSIWWIEYAGLAGIRMDTYPYPDMNYMAEWTADVMNEYPHFNIVGEEWNGNPAIVAYWQRGKKNPNGYESELKSLMDFPLQLAMANALNTEEKNYGSGWILLYEMLGSDFQYADPDNLVVFPDNHDMDRFYTQVKEDFNLFKLGIVYTLTTRGIPQIYYGTEVLMSNKGFPGDHGIIRTDFPGGWKGDQVNAFTNQGLSDQQKEAKDFIRKLLLWRKNASVIHHGKLMHFVPEDGVYVFFRYDQDQKVMIVLNKNTGAYSLKLDRFAEMLKGINSGNDIISGKRFDLKKEMALTPLAPMILELQ